MTNASTINKLIEMHLTAMADAFYMQTKDKSMENLSFEERLSLLVDIEYCSRKNNRLKRLIKNAEFDQPCASIIDVDYKSGRKLNKSLIERLATCEYIVDSYNLIITGATGTGKSYLACAFGMEACKQFYSVKYVRLPELLIDLDISRNEGTFKKVLHKYTKPALLILDEWMLVRLSELECKDLLEIIHKRSNKKSTIFCSQFRIDGWYEKFSDGTIADAIMDRIVHNSYKINIESIDPSRDISMREVFGLDKSISE